MKALVFFSGEYSSRFVSRSRSGLQLQPCVWCLPETGLRGLRDEYDLVVREVAEIICNPEDGTPEDKKVYCQIQAASRRIADWLKHIVVRSGDEPPIEEDPDALCAAWGGYGLRVNCSAEALCARFRQRRLGINMTRLKPYFG